MEKCGSCGFGKKRVRKSHFGSDYTTFFQDNSQTNTFLTPKIRQCLDIIYSNEDKSYNTSSSFGSRSKRLKKINTYINYLLK